MDILTHSFNDSPICQTTQLTEVDTNIIPKGYVNATQMAKAAGKDIREWLKNKSTKALIEGYKVKGKGGEFPFL